MHSLMCTLPLESVYVSPHPAAHSKNRYAKKMIIAAPMSPCRIQSSSGLMKRVQRCLMVCPSAVQAALVVDALEVVKVGDEHVVALVHRHDGADGGTGLCVTAWHTGVVASDCTLGCIDIIADGAPGSVGFTHSHSLVVQVLDGRLQDMMLGSP